MILKLMILEENLNDILQPVPATERRSVKSNEEGGNEGQKMVPKIYLIDRDQECIRRILIALKILAASPNLS